VSTERRRAACW